MKNLFKLFPIAAVAVSSFFFAGCPQDPCDPKKIDCGANGTCIEGLCTCTAGYEGDKCDVLSRTKFLVNGAIGQWKVALGDDSCLATATYTMVFTPSALVNEMSVSNIAGYPGSNGIVKVTGNKFALKSSVALGNPVTVTITDFTGTINAAGTITDCAFKSTDSSGGTANCTMKATKQ